jgi:hypothetical protein
MAWTFNGTRIYVQSLEASTKQIIARLNPLYSGPLAGTAIQIFGWDEEIIKVQAKVVGWTNLNAILGLIDNKTKYTLVGPSYSKACYPSSMSYKMDETYYQTLDTSQDCETPVFTLSMELYYDSV